MEVKPFERMRGTRSTRNAQEVTMLLRPRISATSVESLRPPKLIVVSSNSAASVDTGDQLAALEAENKRLRAGLDRAVKINDRMWNGIVDMKLVDSIRANDSA
jgi:pre-rRNA-processing protein IPI3